MDEKHIQALPLQYVQEDELENSSYAPSEEPRQKLDNFIRFFPTVAFSSNLLATWEAIAVSFQAGLLNGGPTALVWGTLISWIGSTAISASLAEMASMNPTVGAQYRWTSLWAPPGFMSKEFWGLLQGWLTVFAWIITVAQPAFLIGTSIQGLIILNHDNYVPERWHGTLIAWAVFAIPVFVNIFARKALEPIELVGICTHITFFLAWIITLAVLAPHSSASFVFTTNMFGLSGWTNNGVQWCVGLLSAAFPLTGFDGVIHMSDEVKDAPRKVPWSMVYGLIINGAMSFTFMITILFCLGDPETAMDSSTGYPIIQVLYGATGSKVAATAMMSLLSYNGVVAMFSSLASVSRLTWAFSRDNGLGPFSQFFGRVHPKLRIPINALAFVSVIIVLLQLINIGSSTALFAILCASTLGLYLSYVLPLIFFTLAKLRGAQIHYGPFTLGRWGLAINVFAICYAVFIIIWLPFPPYMPVTRENMNYAGPIIGGVLLLAVVDWFMVGGRKRFKVPKKRVMVFSTQGEWRAVR